MSHQVFISYSTKDSATTQSVCGAIESAGYKCWVAPRDVIPGRDYAEEIINAIENCTLMLLVTSDNSNMSAHIKREVEQAVNQGKPVIPFFIEKVELSKSLKYFLSVHHWLDASVTPVEQHFPKLVETLQNLLGVTSQVTVRSPQISPALDSVEIPVPSDEFLERWGLKGVSGSELGAKLLNAIVQQAVAAKATSVHLDASKDGVRLQFAKFRHLKEIDIIPVIHWSRIIGYFRSSCRWSESELSQEGKMAIETGSGLVELRIATLRTMAGESLTITLVGQQTTIEDMSQSGLSHEHEHTLRSLVNSQHGLYLVGGPVGSGKTQTLFWLLQQINKNNLKVFGFFLPVEFKLPGVIQTELDTENGISYEKVLQSIIIQNPNVIVTVDKPDADSLRPLLEAAAMGVRVLCHDDSPTVLKTLKKLIKLGSDSYLLSQNLAAITNQRLLRTICLECKEQVDYGADMLQQNGLEPGTILLSGQRMRRMQQQRVPKGQHRGL
jgi:Tfp pilus assembly pilus retraction ATPase PilT